MNCGSSSLKCQLLDPVSEELLLHCQVDKIGGNTILSLTDHTTNEHFNEAKALPNHDQALSFVLPFLERFSSSIRGIGHRIVHGGEQFKHPVLITTEVEESISQLSSLAPLHNPSNLAGVRATKTHFPGVPNVGMFDTAFHQTIAPHAFLYGLPQHLYSEHKIRRYGFHGHSHYYVSNIVRQENKFPSNRIISVHLGSGCSICAIKDGQSIDTSMGFTPLEGLIMSTRCGDIDGSIPLYLLSMGYKEEEVHRILQRESGLAGISKMSGDMQTILGHYDTNPDVKLAIDMFVYRVRKYIGSFALALGGVDCVIFTGGIGENSSFIREKICNDLTLFGVELDDTANKEGITTTDNKITLVSKGNCRVVVLHTNEELVIARGVAQLLDSLDRKNIQGQEE
eukprot:TRINITY_DN8571_c0_g1_i2.p1 TRINITY_DN8571_c0_g1~~TRINITY_DN8571_c0_g1_i2.p1  ORF type:complete len:449 (+),score=45.83 TRINITY_DN8571_c0_g1_i2:158-1348(+)